ALVKINSKHLIEYSLHNCLIAGIKTVIIIVNSYNKESIFSAIGNEYNGIKILYVIQEFPKGLINAVMSAAEYLNDSVMLQLSDEIFIKPNIKECVDLFESCGYFIVTYVCDNEHENIKNNFSIEIDEKGKVLNCVEKPEKIINDLKGTGLCIFNRDCIELLKNKYDSESNFPDNLCDYFNFLIQSDKTGNSFCIAENEININTTNELEYAQMKIRDEQTQ
ncbi:MAG: hypothetical protein KBT46_09765, partial [Ruminococcus sp.]|nr:hypothetical protein [Candidatus Copronaster equi]